MMTKKDRSARSSRLSSTMVWCAFISAMALLIAAPAPAHSESASFDIAAQPLPAALQAFAAQAHMELLYEHMAVADAIGNAVAGEFDKRAALEQLLRGTGLEIIYSSDKAATIRPARANSNRDITKEQEPKTHQ